MGYCMNPLGISLWGEKQKPTHSGDAERVKNNPKHELVNNEND